MNKFMVLHYGFKKPTPEEMAGWNQWFTSLGDALLEQHHFPEGVEFTAKGSQALPLAADSITGYCIITAADLDAAAQLASQCPKVLATRVYALR